MLKLKLATLHTWFQKNMWNVLLYSNHYNRCSILWNHLTIIYIAKKIGAWKRNWLSFGQVLQTMTKNVSKQKGNTHKIFLDPQQKHVTYKNRRVFKELKKTCTNVLILTLVNNLFAHFLCKTLSKLHTHWCKAMMYISACKIAKRIE